MVLKDYDYVKGNTALQPNRKSTDHNIDKQYEDLRKSKIERKNRLKNKHKQNTRGVIQIVSLIFILGIVTIWRDANVYKMRNDLSNTQKEINLMVNENEALKVELLKASSLENVKIVAEGKLKMVIPAKEDVVKINLTKENFLNEGKKQSMDDNNKNLMTKIKDALFN